MIDFIEKSNADGASSSVRTFDNSNIILKQSAAVTRYDFLLKGQARMYISNEKIFRRI